MDYNYIYIMSIKQFLKKVIFGKVVLDQAKSEINEKIEVTEDLLGEKRIVVDNLTQSGGLVYQIWQEVLKQLKGMKFEIKDVLILGLGGGTAAKIIRKYFPESRILGIELDREMIRLGKKYLGLGEIGNLEIVQNDASAFIQKNKEKFDLILVDLYIGRSIPVSTESEIFLKVTKESLRPDGLIVFNRASFGTNKQKTEEFSRKLQKYYLQIEAKKVLSNILFLCRKIGTK